MAKAYSPDLRKRVLAAVAEGMPLAEAAERFRVSVPSIVRWRALERGGRGVGPKPFAGGRRPVRVEAARDTILALLRENPGLSTEALRAALAKRGLVFSYGSLYRFRQRHGVRRREDRCEARVGAAREAIFALMRGNPGLPTRALRAALAERGFVLDYGTLHRFLARHGLKGKKAGRQDGPAAGNGRTGPRALADDLRQRIVAAVAAGMSYAEAGRLFRVNPVTIARWHGRRR